jgi:hypothetical protein
MGSVVPAALLAVARSILLPFTVAAAWASLRDRDEGRGTRAIAVVICLLPTALWAMWTLWHASAIPDGWAASYGSYTAMWRESWSTPGDLLQLVVRQAAGFARIAAAIWSPLGALLALLLGIAGLARLWTRQRWVVAGLGGYVLLVLLWPIEPDRFVWGVLPLLALLCAGGAAHLAERLRARPMLRYATLLTVALPVAACGRWTANGYRNDGWIVPQEIASRNASPLVSWGRTLPRDAVVLTGNDPLFALATGLRAAPALPPDLGEAGGRQLLSPATRLERSACALGHGWLAAGDSADQVAVALRQLLASPGGRLAVTERVQLNGRGEAWKFSCSQ